MVKTITIIAILLMFFNGSTCFSQNCGVERWAVKTLTDKDTSRINFNLISPTTIHEQLLLEAPLQRSTRLTNEAKVYSLSCSIIGYKREKNDQDIHLIIEDIQTEERMVAEIPNYQCLERVSASRYEFFKKLQEWFVDTIGKPKSKFTYPKSPIPVTITGLGFFDFKHGQKGMAANGREIHPVLSIKLNNTIK